MISLQGWSNILPTYEIDMKNSRSLVASGACRGTLRERPIIKLVPRPIPLSLSSFERSESSLSQASHPTRRRYTEARSLWGQHRDRLTIVGRLGRKGKGESEMWTGILARISRDFNEE
jgi:hypothetical protein